MTFQQLRYFVETASTGSINKAARNLHVSQPALSTAVKELEAELGVTLFERTRHGMILTAEGVDFLGMAEGVLSQMERIQHAYSLKDSELVRFQISSQHYAFVVDAFIRFMDKWKNTRYMLNVKETKTIEVLDDVALRRSAMGIICLTDMNRHLIAQILSRKQLEFHELVEVKPHVFLNRNHPLANKTKIALTELEPYPSVVYAQGSHEHLDELGLMEEALIAENANQIIYTHDRGTMNNILANTPSYNIGSGYLIPGIIPQEIISIPVEWSEGGMHIGWIHPAQRRPSEMVMHFVELLSISLHGNSPVSIK